MAGKHSHKSLVRRGMTQQAGPSAYIGRVGGLAASLGVGAVIFLGLGVGVAAAETGSADSSPGPSTSTATGGDQDSAPRNASRKDVKSGPKQAGEPRALRGVDDADEATASPRLRAAAIRGQAGPESDSDDTVGAGEASDDERVQEGDVNAAEQPPSGAAAIPDVVTDAIQAEVLPAGGGAARAATSPAGPLEAVLVPADERSPNPAAPGVASVSSPVTVGLPLERAEVSTGRPEGTQPGPVGAALAATLAGLGARQADAGATPTVPVVAEVHNAQEALTAVAPSVADAQFTGRPSLVNQIFVAVLRVVKPILSALGISLTGSSRSIPLFTDGIPPFFMRGGLVVTNQDYEFEDGTMWKVWTLTPKSVQAEPGKVVIALHGGSFISEASIFHWWTYTDMARQTGATVIVPLYPLAKADGTGGRAATVVPNTAEFFAKVSDQYGGQNVSVLGDSAGGSIALAAMQVAVARCKADTECDSDADLPGHLVLFAPSLDSGLTNPNIGLIDDPLLTASDLRANGALWAAGLPGGTTNPLASPIYGSLEDLPPVTVYAGSIDLRAADVLLLQQKAAQTPNAEFNFVLRNGQVHDWLIFAFLPDAHAIRPSVYEALGLTSPV